MIAAAAWPEERAAEAQAALAAACRLPGAEAEPVEVAYAEVAAFLHSGPALVAVPGGVVAVRRVTRRGALVLAPDGAVRRLPAEALRAAVCAAVEAPVAAEIDGLLATASVPERHRPAARAALLRARLAGQRVAVGAALVPPVSAPARTLFRAARLRGALAVVVAAHAGVYALFLLSWAVVGGAAVAGRLDARAVLVWVADSAALVATRAVATSSAGRLALGAGQLLKRRLLAGVLRLEPEEIRAQGAGPLLGVVLEAEQLETLALTGGYLGLLASVELAAAAVALVAGARGGRVVAALAVWVALALALGRVGLRRRREWTGTRLALTHDLVERLAGHRTRLAFEGAAVHRFERERAALAGYAERSRRLDRADTALVACVPRGWVAIGAAVLVLPSPAALDPAGLAIGIGGVLLGWQALRKLTLGLSQLAGAAVAWDCVAPLARAARRPPRTAGADAVAGDDIPLLEARDLTFAHPGRAGPVLSGVNVTVRHGERILLGGPSGAGKSTLASVLAGLRLPASGSLRLAGADRLEVADEAWRRRVVMAPQFGENHVLSASVAFNLLLGRRWPPTPADLADAEAVCRDLGLGGLLDEMPAGLAQPLGETGWQLSHGERSRLFAARALLSGADLVVLDESFAALDPEALATALACVLARAPTLLVIAHE